SPYYLWTLNPAAPTTGKLVRAGDEILIGGSFTMVGGVSHKRIARFSADALDATFNPDITDGAVKTIVKSGSQILVGGSFTTVTVGTTTPTRNRVARLNSDGTL